MKLILVGGFLGAGKTTLLWECARRLAARGASVGLITNDQAPDLVDTAILTLSGSRVQEVAGSCFCCNFIGFRRAFQSLANDGAEYVIAEPVGSCTDLSATILQPLKARHPEHRVAPLTVLIDPRRVREVLQRETPLLHADAAYILRLQLEEADQILLTKADTLDEEERGSLLALLQREFAGTPVAAISSQSGDGIDAWLDGVLEDGVAGARIVEVDYDRYANGEAVLGWLNAVVGLRCANDAAPRWEVWLADFAKYFVEQLKRGDAEEVGHLKLLLEARDGHATANLTGLRESMHMASAGVLNAREAKLTVNARVQTQPDVLEAALRSALAAMQGHELEATLQTIHCLKPGRPEPTYRYASVVA